MIYECCKNQDLFEVTENKIYTKLSSSNSLFADVFEICKHIIKKKEDPIQRFYALFLAKEVVKRFMNEKIF